MAKKRFADLPYTKRLDAFKSAQNVTLAEIGDQWRTPDWLFEAINAMMGGRIALDLFTDMDNAKCDAYYTAEINALKQDWASTLADISMTGKVDYPMGYANPPYSISQDEAGDPLTGMVRIMEYAVKQRDAGAPTVWIVKSATSETWWPDAVADKTIFIKGRIAFEAPLWYTGTEKVSGAGFGAAILIFDKDFTGSDLDPRFGIPEDEKISYVDRELLRKIGTPLVQPFTPGPHYWFHDPSESFGVVYGSRALSRMMEHDDVRPITLEEYNRLQDDEL